jgi:hypothetical protein
MDLPVSASVRIAFSKKQEEKFGNVLITLKFYLRINPRRPIAALATQE